MSLTSDIVEMGVCSHVLIGIVHGGVDDGAGLTLWIDDENNVAHLVGHSGSMVPLSGPMAPVGVQMAQATGRAGTIRIFDEEEISSLVCRIEDILGDYIAGPNRELDAVRLQAIEVLLEDTGLEGQSYTDWLKDNEPETWDDLYGSPGPGPDAE